LVCAVNSKKTNSSLSCCDPPRLHELNAPLSLFSTLAWFGRCSVRSKKFKIKTKNKSKPKKKVRTPVLLDPETLFG
jgi:hypothetical protein